MEKQLFIPVFSYNATIPFNIYRRNPKRLSTGTLTNQPKCTSSLTFLLPF